MSEEKPRKKRGAERQLTQLNVDQEEEEETVGGTGTSGTEQSQRAPPEVLAKRRIVRAVRPASSSSSSKPAAQPGAGPASSPKAANPFASASLQAGKKDDSAKLESADQTRSKTTPVFGSSTGFSGFAAVASSSTGGFGSISASNGGFGNSGTAGGFFSSSSGNKTQARTEASQDAAADNAEEPAAQGNESAQETAKVTPADSKSLFGSPSASSSKFSISFGSASASGNDGSDSGADAAGSGRKNIVKLPKDVELKTGEEDEYMLMSVRCKSFIWVRDSDKTADKKENEQSLTGGNIDGSSSSVPTGVASPAAHPSVAPSAAFTAVAKKAGDKKDVPPVATEASPGTDDKKEAGKIDDQDKTNKDATAKKETGKCDDSKPENAAATEPSKEDSPSKPAAEPGSDGNRPETNQVSAAATTADSSTSTDKEKTVDADSTAPSSKPTASVAAGNASTPKGTWQELGIGPLRILQTSSMSFLESSDDKTKKRIRLVQRRESTPNGPGTKVIANVPLWKESKLKSVSEKHVSVTTFTQGSDSSMYLFKFKEAHEAGNFRTTLEILLPECKSVSG